MGTYWYMQEGLIQVVTLKSQICESFALVFKV